MQEQEKLIRKYKSSRMSLDLSFAEKASMLAKEKKCQNVLAKLKSRLKQILEEEEN